MLAPSGLHTPNLQEVYSRVCEHTAGVNSAAISPDGNTIASANRDNTVKLWQPDGKLLTTLSGHSAGVNSVTFSPDGKKIVSGSDDRTVILWNLQQVLDLDGLHSYGCDWVRDYLNSNRDLSKSDRHLCEREY